MSSARPLPHRVGVEGNSEKGLRPAEQKEDSCVLSRPLLVPP